MARRALQASASTRPCREAEALAETETFKAGRRRRQKVGMLFARLRQKPGFGQSRMRGAHGAAEALNLAAAVQKPRRLARLKTRASNQDAEIALPG